MDELRFDDRVAIVTGAGRGMGRCHALLLAERGAQVVVADLGGATDGTGSSAGPADEVVAEIRSGGGAAVASCASVADPDGAAAIVDAALDAFGRLDVVVNNAGISDPGSFEDLALEQFRRMIDVHYFGTLHVMKAAWPHLRARGYGRIVNVTSESLLGILPKLTSYGGAKGGVLALTRNAAVEGPEHGILVNGLMPRAETRMTDAATMSMVLGVPEEMLAEAMPTLPPALTSPVAAFLAHESCRLNGEVLATGAGLVQRLALFETVGATVADLTPEDVAANLDQIMDLTDAQLITVTPPR